MRTTLREAMQQKEAKEMTRLNEFAKYQQLEPDGKEALGIDIRTHIRFDDKRKIAWYLKAPNPKYEKGHFAIDTQCCLVLEDGVLTHRLKNAYITAVKAYNAQVAIACEDIATFMRKVRNVEPYNGEFWSVDDELNPVYIQTTNKIW